MSKLTSIKDLNDIIVSNEEHILRFLDDVDLQDSVWVFDFDGNLIHKGFNSFAPIDYADADHEGVLEKMKTYMLCIEDSLSYTHLDKILKDQDVSLPDDVRTLSQQLDFQDFKDNQMNHRWDFTMQKAVEWKLPMNNFDLADLSWRPGAKELVSTLLDHNIQVLIISSGIGNLIRHAVSESGFDLDHPCLQVKSNDFLLDEEGYCEGYDPDLITPFTKMHVDYHKYGISDKKFAIQSGNSLGDAQMITDHFPRKHILNIGFTNGKKSKLDTFPDRFDIVMTKKSSSFEHIQKLLLHT